MGFDIGERVVSKWTGLGTIKGAVFYEDGVRLQLVTFDDPMFGTKFYPVGKLEAVESKKGEAGGPKEAEAGKEVPERPPGS